MGRQAYPVAKAAEAVERAIAAGDHGRTLERTEALVARLEDAGAIEEFEADLDTLLDALETGPPLDEREAADARAAVRAIEHRFSEELQEDLESMDETLETAAERVGTAEDLRAFETRIEEAIDE